MTDAGDRHLEVDGVQPELGWAPSGGSVLPKDVIRLTPSSPSQYSDITRRVDIGISVARDIGTILHKPQCFHAFVANITRRV